MNGAQKAFSPLRKRICRIPLSIQRSKDGKGRFFLFYENLLRKGDSLPGRDKAFMHDSGILLPTASGQSRYTAGTWIFSGSFLYWRKK